MNLGELYKIYEKSFMPMPGEILDNEVNILIGDTRVDSFEGIERFKDLQQISLTAHEFKEFDVGHYSNLYRLYIRGSSLKNLKGVDCFSNLTDLDVSYNPLESLDGIEVLKNLEAFFFITKEKKDLSFFLPILKLPNLQYLVIKDHVYNSVDKVKWFREKLAYYFEIKKL